MANNGKKVIYKLDTYYKVSCYAHSGGVDDILDSEDNYEFKPDFDYGENTELCKGYIRSANGALSWNVDLDNDDAFYQALENFKGEFQN